MTLYGPTKDWEITLTDLLIVSTQDFMMKGNRVNFDPS